MKISIGPLGCIALLPAVASAFQPLVTDDTGTQGVNGNQVEAAYNRTVEKAPGTRDVTHELQLVFTRGIVRNIMDGDATTTQATAGLTWRFR